MYSGDVVERARNGRHVPEVLRHGRGQGQARPGQRGARLCPPDQTDQLPSRSARQERDHGHRRTVEPVAGRRAARQGSHRADQDRHPHLPCADRDRPVTLHPMVCTLARHSMIHFEKCQYILSLNNLNLIKVTGFTFFI